MDEKLFIAEIECLIERILRAKKAISFHITAEKPDANAIENYNRLCSQYKEELKELLQELDIDNEQDIKDSKKEDAAFLVRKTRSLPYFEDEAAKYRSPC